mgnify:CR=1 FL=1
MAKLNKPSLGTTIRQNSSGVLAALMCIVIGLVIGLIALFIINRSTPWWMASGAFCRAAFMTSRMAAARC